RRRGRARSAARRRAGRPLAGGDPPPPARSPPRHPRRRRSRHHRAPRRAGRAGPGRSAGELAGHPRGHRPRRPGARRGGAGRKAARRNRGAHRRGARTRRGTAPRARARGLRLAAARGGRPRLLRRRAPAHRRRRERRRRAARSLPLRTGGARTRPGRRADRRRHLRLRGAARDPRLGGATRLRALPGPGPARTAGGGGARRPLAPAARRSHNLRRAREGGKPVSQLAAPRAAALGARRFSVGRTAAILGALTLLLAILFALGALAGAEPLDLGRALSDPHSLDARILFGLRLPRLVLAAIVGIGLAAAGAAYQALLRNPLADPFLLGVSGGAALGGTLALALGATVFS